ARVGEDQWDLVWQDDEKFRKDMRIFHAVILENYDHALELFDAKAAERMMAEEVLLAAVAADALGNQQQRDGYWRLLVERDKPGEKPVGSSVLDEVLARSLAALLLASSEGLPRQEQVNALLAKAKTDQPTSYSKMNYFLGRFFEARGEDERALEYYHQAIRSSSRALTYVAGAFRRIRQLSGDATKIQIPFNGISRYAP
ncbi:MAG: hypothetical protein MI861_15260, partial [Pirellulales bacterium]|nr:hypothetical protein [Pirellulales bacterium]